MIELGGGSVSSGWELTANTAKLDRSVAQGARDKRTVIRGNGKDTVTIMVYMCGTDLESRSGMGTADLRYRGEFRNWYADIELSYTPAFGFTLEALVNILNAGGYACGVGEWRTERDGLYGKFHVETVK